MKILLRFIEYVLDYDTKTNKFIKNFDETL